ncbi:serine-rich adhesin for platelets-like [Watersipora subatra]|uniref:serine-rich adhesin for platelets-like n=1 Tax=Watersipora subatra TaxID=2589382 RepID=UPI00355ACE01
MGALVHTFFRLAFTNLKYYQIYKAAGHTNRYEGHSNRDVDIGMNLYTKLETFGPKNLFLEFVKFTGYYTKTKKHFCGICPIRRPADHFDPGSFQTHISSTEHTRNVQVIKQLYDRSVRGCIYMCAKDCIINHELLSQKPLSHPAVSLASSRSISETSKSSIASQVSKSSKTDQTGSSDAVSGQIKATAPRRLSLNSVQGIFQSVKSAMVYNDSNNTLAPSTVKATSQLVSQSSAGKITSSNVESKIIAQSVDNAKNTHVEDAKKSSLLSSALTSSTHCEKKSQKTKERKPLSEKKRKDVANTAESDEAAKKSSKCSPREKTLSPSDSDRRTTSSSSARYSQTSHRSVYGQPYRSYKYDSSTSFRHRNYKNSFQQNRKSYSRRDSSSRRSNSRSRKRSYRSRSRSSSSERISKSKHQRSKESSKRHRYRSISKSGDSRDSSQERASHKKARTRVKAGHHYSYKSPGNSKRRRSRRSRSETSSSSSDRTQHSSRSSRSSKIRSRRSKSFASSSDSSSTESTCSSSTISRRRQCSSSRSLSTCSPRGQRRGKRSRSPSKSSPLASKRVDVHRQFRYISPPPFPLGNSSIYCINPDFEKLNVRSLSPVSADVVSRTVENAWKFYHSRYYSQSELSTDIVYDAQVLFLKSYSGFFMQAPNFENCYNSLYKPEDLKAALRMRLDRLSPGPAKDPNVTISKRESPEYQNNMVTSSQPALKSDAAHQHSNNIPNTAESMKTLIKTGAVPGLSLMDDSETCAYNMSASSTVSADPANDGIRNAIESLRQSYSGASAKEETFDHGDLDSLTLAERKTSESFIPFLNDGTLDEVRNLPDNQESKKISNSDMELPWHYKQHSASRSPEDICETVLSKEDAYTTNNLSTNMLSMNNNHQNACKKYSQNVISEQKQEVDKKEKSKKEEDKLQSVGGVVMSAFIADVVKGIIRLSTLQTDTELSPTEMLNEMEHEQEKMHSRMITPAGHYMINMAKRILSPESGQSLQLEFDKADPEAVELMKTLDVRVVELIASTPFLSE